MFDATIEYLDRFYTFIAHRFPGLYGQPMSKLIAVKKLERLEVVPVPARPVRAKPELRVVDDGLEKGLAKAGLDLNNARVQAAIERERQKGQS